MLLILLLLLAVPAQAQTTPPTFEEIAALAQECTNHEIRRDRSTGKTYTYFYYAGWEDCPTIINEWRKQLGERTNEQARGMQQRLMDAARALEQSQKEPAK